MHLARQQRGVLIVALLVLAGAVGALWGCTMSEDRITGVTLDHRGANRCVKECVDDFEDLVKDEAKRHREQLKECGKQGDSEGDSEEDSRVTSRKDPRGDSEKDSRGGSEKDSRGDPKKDPGNRECYEAEIARHRAVMDQIHEGKRDCMNDCHRQGNGHGG